MKICCIGFDLPEGKVKYQDELVITLDQKLSPKKITPFYVEFTRDDFSHCDGFLVAREKIWDLLSWTWKNWRPGGTGPLIRRKKSFWISA
jgi:hypothetical protein